MVHVATLVALNLLLPATQPFETVQFGDRADIVLKPIDAAEAHARRHMDIGRHYFVDREFLAALNRLRVVVTQFQASRHVEEALALLTEAYLALGLDSEAQTATAVLSRKFPHGHWCAEARDSLRAAALEPAENETSWISRALK
jgi:outer membrane protein assembly factor BamD